LTDRRFSARHLPPARQHNRPPVDELVSLFRREGAGRCSNKSTLLFAFFAQWFTDGFLHTDPFDPRENTSTHQIDLSQLYGQTPDVTTMRRAGCHGLLRYEKSNGAEYPPRYFDPRTRFRRPEFAMLNLAFPGSDRKALAPELKERHRDRRKVRPPDLDSERTRSLFALGIPRGNIHYGFASLSTLFLREHNRLARAIACKHATWGDERIFQTARNTLIAMLLKIVVADYINHISPFHFKLFVNRGLGARELWFRTNWMSIEFDLLYRWHSLVPTTVTVAGVEHDFSTLLWDNRMVSDVGVTNLLQEASLQRCNEIGLFNTPDFLLSTEKRAIEIARATDLASYNEYRYACGFPYLRSFGDLPATSNVRAALAARYSTVDDIDLYVGLFAEDVVHNGALPPLMGAMVGLDAFTQALTNPLLASTVAGEATSSSVGLDAPAKTNSLDDIVKRNLDHKGQNPQVSFTYSGDDA
jgi:prostaglandin-endoperoxide synthase 2